MMNDHQWNTAKADYEAIPIPPELDARIRQGIREGSAVRKRIHRVRAWGAAAACFALVLAGLNLSPAIASAAADLPVVGNIFEVLTVRNYGDTNEDRTLSVAQPGLSGTDFAQRIDDEIQARVEEKIAEGEARIAAEREAFFATGGTEEDWAKRNNEVHVDYDIRYQSDSRASFVVDTYVATSVTTQEQYFYNLDLSLDRELTLKDLLGDDWAAICDQSIRAQMSAAEDPTVFFPEEQGGFSGVDGTTSFYINASGNPVVVFPKYSIAIGAMGPVEFEIAP